MFCIIRIRHKVNEFVLIVFIEYKVIRVRYFSNPETHNATCYRWSYIYIRIMYGALFQFPG